MEALLQFREELVDGRIGWTAIRTSPLEEQMLPLCGMVVSGSGTVRVQANEYYPCLDLKGTQVNAENLEAHFKSLLQFSADQVSAGTGIAETGSGERCYYSQVLEYVEENGVYSYGCYAAGTPETFLALIESGAVSQVWLEDIWISV